MEAVVKAFRNVNYEFFGIILPGLFALLGIGGLILLDFMAFSIVSFGEMGTYYRETVVPNWYIALGVLLLGTYLAGHFLKRVSKDGIFSVMSVEVIGRTFNKVAGRWRVTVWLASIVKWLHVEMLWLRFLLLLGKTNPKLSHRASYADLEAELRKQLQHRLNLSGADKSLQEWHDFYVLAKTFIGSIGQESLIANYQDKYTFHRSLASLFALMFWISCASAVVFWRLQIQPMWINLMIGVAVASFMFMKHFVTSFTEFWRLFGDIVLAELSVSLALEKKTP